MATKPRANKKKLLEKKALELILEIELAKRAYLEEKLEALERRVKVLEEAPLPPMPMPEPIPVPNIPYPKEIPNPYKESNSTEWKKWKSEYW